jgi:hypothetical protein
MAMEKIDADAGNASLDKAAFIAFGKTTNVSVGGEIAKLMESKWESDLGKIFKLVLAAGTSWEDADNSGSVDLDTAKKLFLTAGCPVEHFPLEKTATDGDGDGDGSLDKTAFIAFGKTANRADGTIESFIASLYFEVTKLIVADVKDVKSKDEGGEQKGDVGDRDVIHVTVDTGVRICGP